jgi:cytochrome P450
MLFLLLLAGHETTTHLISGFVRELLRNPGLRDWLEEDWSRADLGRDVEYGHSPRLQPRPLRPPQAGLTRALRRTARETG